MDLLQSIELETFILEPGLLDLDRRFWIINYTLYSIDTIHQSLSRDA
ncbi:MAG: hypothetical protein QW101_07015 [Ignisphaera sp.]